MNTSELGAMAHAMVAKHRGLLAAAGRKALSVGARLHSLAARGAYESWMESSAA